MKFMEQLPKIPPDIEKNKREKINQEKEFGDVNNDEEQVKENREQLKEEIEKLKEQIKKSIDNN